MITLYTAGPWKIHRLENGEPYLVTTGDERESVAYVGEGRAQVFRNKCEANAHLIAAAPEVFEALKRLEFAAQCRENTMGDPCRLLEVQAELRAAAQQARDAIAKATKTP